MRALLALLTVWQVWPALIAAAGCAYGHAARRVERIRFTLTLTVHGYANHAQYVAGSRWRGRRSVFYHAHGRGPCWCCARRLGGGTGWVPILHHLDYSRAGGGGEYDRDLRCVCEPCHHRFHRWDRPRGLLRACGVTLRWTTYLVFAAWWPVRLTRRAVR